MGGQYCSTISVSTSAPQQKSWRLQNPLPPLLLSGQENISRGQASSPVAPSPSNNARFELFKGLCVTICLPAELPQLFVKEPWGNARR